MAVYVGPLLLVLFGLGGLIFLIGKRARAGVQETLPIGSVAEQPAEHAVRSSAARIPLPKISGITQRLRRLLSAFGRSGGMIVRLIGRVMRVVLRRPSARVPEVAAPASFQASAFRAQTSPPAVSDSVTAPRFLESEAMESEEESASEAPDVLDELAPHQREISVPKSWASAALRPLRRGSVSSRPAPAVTREALRGIEPLPSAPPETSEAPDRGMDEAEPTEQGSALPVALFAVQAIPGVEEVDQENVQDEPPSVAPAPAAPEEEPALTLEPHVRERVAGRQKIVGRVRARRKESARSRKRETAVSPASPKPSPSVADVAEEGIESIPILLERGHLARAEDILTDLLAANPGDLAAYRWLALVHIQRGEYAQAKEVCEEGLRRDPDEISLQGPLGRAYAGLGQYSKALPMLQQAHNSDERNLDYLEQLLLIAARMDHRALVRVTAQKILVLQPDHPLAKKHLARVAAAV